MKYTYVRKSSPQKRVDATNQTTRTNTMLSIRKSRQRAQHKNPHNIPAKVVYTYTKLYIIYTQSREKRFKSRARKMYNLTIFHRTFACQHIVGLKSLFPSSINHCVCALGCVLCVCTYIKYTRICYNVYAFISMYLHCKMYRACCTEKRVKRLFCCIVLIRLKKV